MSPIRKKFTVQFMDGSTSEVEAERYFQRDNDYLFVINETESSFDTAATVPRERVKTITEKVTQ